MVLEECNQHPGRGHAGVVQRVGQIRLPVRTLHADAEAARLCVAEIRAGADLKILLLPGRPCLDVAALDLQIGQIAGAALDKSFSRRYDMPNLPNR